MASRGPPGNCAYAKSDGELRLAGMHPHLAFWQAVVAGLGVAFGLGGLARLRTKPERGLGDRASAWGLILTGSILVVHGVSVLLGRAI